MGEGGLGSGEVTKLHWSITATPATLTFCLITVIKMNWRGVSLYTAKIYFQLYLSCSLAK